MIGSVRLSRQQHPGSIANVRGAQPLRDLAQIKFYFFAGLTVFFDAPWSSYSSR
jgi:ABC-type protease/lipase transport system fused ATPase/permease subunit